MAETFTDGLRRRVQTTSGQCPTCGQPTVEGGVRALAKTIGVSHTSLWRFLRGGNPSSELIDVLVAWLAPADPETPA